LEILDDRAVGVLMLYLPVIVPLEVLG